MKYLNWIYYYYQIISEKYGNPNTFSLQIPDFSIKTYNKTMNICQIAFLLYVFIEK